MKSISKMLMGKVWLKCTKDDAKLIRNVPPVSLNSCHSERSKKSKETLEEIILHHNFILLFFPIATGSCCIFIDHIQQNDDESQQVSIK